MKLPSSSFSQIDCHSSDALFEASKADTSSQPLPPNKMISKKTVQKRNFKRISRIGTQHNKIDPNLNYSSMNIEETTQQPHNSSSQFKQERQSETWSQTIVRLESNECEINLNSDTQRVFEFTGYLDSILNHALAREVTHTPKEILDKENISENSRASIVSWIFQLSSRFRFKQETAYCAVNIIDKTLGLKRIVIERLPLLGITALFMATKYEQIMIPHLSNFVAIVPGHYKVTNQQVLSLESFLLKVFNFDLGYVSPLFYIHHCDLLSELNLQIKNRAIQVSKQLILSSKYHYWPSSKLASEAIQIAESELQTLTSTTSLDSFGPESMLRT